MQCKLCSCHPYPPPLTRFGKGISLLIQFSLMNSIFATLLIQVLLYELVNSALAQVAIAYVIEFHHQRNQMTLNLDHEW